MLCVGMQFVTLCVTSVPQHNVVSCAQSLYIDKALFYRGGTDDAECDLSDRAKEPDEVGPETGARGFAYFGPMKVGRRGAKR